MSIKNRTGRTGKMNSRVPEAVLFREERWNADKRKVIRLLKEIEIAEFNKLHRSMRLLIKQCAKITSANYQETISVGSVRQQTWKALNDQAQAYRAKYLGGN